MKAHQVETYFKVKNYYANGGEVEFEEIAKAMTRLKEADTEEDKLEVLIDLWDEAFCKGHESF